MGDTPMTDDSLSLGVFEDTGEEYLYSGRESLITIARPGQGKSQAHVIRNLLRLKAPAIVLDVKPEIYAATYFWRNEWVGPVMRFEPRDRKGSLHFNPLDAVRSDPIDAYEDVGRIVPLLMVPKDKAGSKSFWESRAAQFLTAAIYDVCLNTDMQPSGRRDMPAVVDWFSVSEAQFAKQVIRLQESPHRVLSRLGNQLDCIDPDVQSSIFETVLSHIEVWGSPQLEPLVDRTSFDLNRFRIDEGTLYLCVTEADLVTYRPVIRALLGHVLHVLKDDVARWDLPPVTFFIDEFPQLGYMEEVEQMVALGRQPGLRLWFFAQSLGQIEKAYGDASRLLDMLALRAYMSPTGSLAEKLSKELGKVRDVFSGVERPLATAQELSGPEYSDKVIVLEGGKRPAKLEKIMAYEDPEIEGWIGLSEADG